MIKARQLTLKWHYYLLVSNLQTMQKFLTIVPIMSFVAKRDLRSCVAFICCVSL